jgi:hypothetical protein
MLATPFGLKTCRGFSGRNPTVGGDEGKRDVAGHVRHQLQLFARVASKPPPDRVMVLFAAAAT